MSFRAKRRRVVEDSVRKISETFTLYVIEILRRSAPLNDISIKKKKGVFNTHPL